MAESIAEIVKRGSIYIPRDNCKMFIKRLKLDGTYDADWFEITKYVTSYPVIKQSFPDEVYVGEYKDEDVSITVDNSKKKFNDITDFDSLFYGYRTRYKTLFKFEMYAVDKDENDVLVKAWYGISFTNPTTNDLSDMTFNLSSTVKILANYSASGIDLTSGTTEDLVNRLVNKTKDGISLFNAYFTGFKINPNADTVMTITSPYIEDKDTVLDKLRDYSFYQDFYYYVDNDGYLVWENKNTNRNKINKDASLWVAETPNTTISNADNKIIIACSVNQSSVKGSYSFQCNSDNLHIFEWTAISTGASTLAISGSVGGGYHSSGSSGPPLGNVDADSYVTFTPVLGETITITIGITNISAPRMTQSASVIKCYTDTEWEYNGAGQTDSTYPTNIESISSYYNDIDNVYTKIVISCAENEVMDNKIFSGIRYDDGTTTYLSDANSATIYAQMITDGYIGTDSRLTQKYLSDRSTLDTYLATSWGNYDVNIIEKLDGTVKRDDKTATKETVWTIGDGSVADIYGDKIFDATYKELTLAEAETVAQRILDAYKNPKEVIEASVFGTFHLETRDKVLVNYKGEINVSNPFIIGVSLLGGSDVLAGRTGSINLDDWTGKVTTVLINPNDFSIMMIWRQV